MNLQNNKEGKSETEKKRELNKLDDGVREIGIETARETER